MSSFNILSGWEHEIKGKSIYMMIGLYEDNKMKYFNTGSPDFPKFDKDWKALNYFINLSDIMIISSKNIEAEPHLRLIPRPEVLQSMNCEVIEKKRSCVVMTRQGVVDYSNNFFKDDLNFFVYSLSECQSPYTVLTSEEFSLDFVVNKVKESCGIESCTTLCLFGGVLFDVLIRNGDRFEFILFTEMMSRRDGLPIVGEIEYGGFEGEYSVVFCSEVYSDLSGDWRFRLFRLNR